MVDKLEAYLEEIGHFLSGRAERAEILSEIRSHILEKAAEGPGEFTGAGIEKAIAAFGPAREVAERYLAESRPIIAPAYRRYLFRYATLLFAVHALLTVAAVALNKSFVLFPFLFMPRLGVLEALMYLPTAFLADLGIVAAVLYFITQSGKDVRLPWPRFAVDLDEVRPPAKSSWLRRIPTAVGAVVMLALTDFALHLFAKHGTIFLMFPDGGDPRPFFTAAAGRSLSLIVVAMLAASSLTLLAKLITRSRWVDVVSDAVALVLIGLLLRQPFEGLFAAEIADRLLPKLGHWAKYSILVTILFIALMITVDLVKNVVVIGRRRLARNRA